MYYISSSKVVEYVEEVVLDVSLSSIDYIDIIGTMTILLCNIEGSD